jgi:Lipase (class 2)
VFAGQAVTNQPVLFIHGNSDSALGTGSSLATGWRSSIDYFKSQGYTSAELYATTWGPANAAFSSQQYHSNENLTRLRAFVQAVKAYTCTASRRAASPRRTGRRRSAGIRTGISGRRTRRGTGSYGW